jgi:hypothetical protein
MATTTNYSWSTPDDTALVKDGAAAIRTLGSSADTTVKGLNPGTTAGDIDYYTTSTAKARVGIGTAGQVLKVNSGATAPEWGVDPTNDLITTAGDLVYGTAADTMTRLGIGTAGQVLTVNSGATAPEWVTVAAGGQTLLSTTAMSGSSTITVSSISSAYKHLLILVEGAYQASSSSTLTYKLNNSANCHQYRIKYVNTTLTVTSNEPSSFDIGTLYASSDKPFFMQLFIPRYSDTTHKKAHFINTGASDGSNWVQIYGNNVLNSTSAVDRFDITAGANFAGGNVRVYGVS